MYPNLYVLLKICCTIPATSCECERSASALRRLHTFNRASMTQERLSSLALMHIHYLTEFLLFLNSDIGIVILYIVKYIRKAFSLPKKINFEVQNLTNIHVFRFAFSDLYCYHTDLQNARNAVSDNLIFKIFRGHMPPDPPSKERLRRSLVRIIN